MRHIFLNGLHAKKDNIIKNYKNLVHFVYKILQKIKKKFKLSIGSTRTKLSNMMRISKNHAVIGTNTHALFHTYHQIRPITFNRMDMQLLNNMKQLVHDNLNPFLGISFNEKEELILLWKFCSRGSIQVRL